MWFKHVHEESVVCSLGPTKVLVMFNISDFVHIVYIYSPMLFDSRCEPLTSSVCQTLYPAIFQHYLHIPGRIDSVDDLTQASSSLSSSLDHACNKGLGLLVCHYLYPPCTDDGKVSVE